MAFSDEFMCAYAELKKQRALSDEYIALIESHLDDEMIREANECCFGYQKTGLDCFTEDVIHIMTNYDFTLCEALRIIEIWGRLCG